MFDCVVLMIGLQKTSSSHQWDLPNGTSEVERQRSKVLKSEPLFQYTSLLHEASISANL